MFQKKPVSKYSTFQNIWFMIKLACTSQEKKVLVISFFIALLTIIQNLLNLYVSPVILSAIENHVSIQELLFTIVIFVLMIMLVSAALAYANQNVICGRISVRCEIVNLLNQKASTTSYPNIDDMKFKKLLTKSAEYTDNNDQATEAIWNTLTVLLINIVCFFIYAGLLTQIHPILILVILSTAGISYFISQRLDEYKYQHREEEAEYIHQMAYLLNRAADFGAAKDIRIFGLRSWLEELYIKADREFTAFHRKAESVYIWAGIADLTFTFLRNGAVYAYLIYLVLYRGLDVPAFLLYFTAANSFSGWITGILERLGTLHRQSLDISTVRECLDYPELFRFKDGLTLNQDAKNNYEIVLENVSFRYPGAETDTLKNINLEIKPGEFLCVVGKSGCGKSTLLNLIAGLEKPTEGKIFLNGKEVKAPSSERTVMFQEHALFPWLNVIQNIKFGMEINGVPKKEQDCRAEKYLKMMQLEDYKNYAIHQLSGGMRQRVALARAFTMDSEILLMDEPFSALDKQTSNHLRQELQDIWMKTHQTIFFITHSVEEAVYLGDRVVVMSGEDGGIKNIVPIELDRPRHVYNEDFITYRHKILGEIQGGDY